MRVFSACIRVVRGNWRIILIYFSVFSLLAVLITTFSSEQLEKVFNEEKVPFTFINRDEESPLVDGLYSLLREKGKEISLPDVKEKLQDAVFFNHTESIIIVPPGFSGVFLSGDEVKLETVSGSKATGAFLMKAYTDQYLRLYRLYETAFPDMDPTETAQAATRDTLLTAGVEMKHYSMESPFPTVVQALFSTAMYSVLMLCIMVVTSIFMTFEQPDLRRRNLVSPVSLRSQNLQKALAIFLLCTVCWFFMTLVSTLTQWKAILEMDIRLLGLSILNSFVFLLVSVSIAFVLGLFIKSFEVQNMAGNLIALGMSFLCGAFGQREFLDESVRSASRFLPGYWYVSALGEISNLSSVTGDNLRSIWTAMLLQLGFAAAIFAVGLAISKVRRQSDSGNNRMVTGRR